MLAAGDYGVDSELTNTKDTGIIYVYRSDDKQSWNRWSELTPMLYPNNYYSYMNFGQCVSLSYDGNLLTVGAPGGSKDFPFGYVLVYRWDEGLTSNQNSVGDWSKVKDLYPNDPKGRISWQKFRFGTVLSGDSSTLLVELLTLNSDQSAQFVTYVSISSSAL